MIILISQPSEQWESLSVKTFLWVSGGIFCVGLKPEGWHGSGDLVGGCQKHIADIMGIAHICSDLTAMALLCCFVA